MAASAILRAVELNTEKKVLERSCTNMVVLLNMHNQKYITGSPTNLFFFNPREQKVHKKCSQDVKKCSQVLQDVVATIPEQTL